MTINEYIRQIAKSNIDMKHASFEKMIYAAYYMGREEATREVSDEYAALIQEQRKRANECRYSRMANAIIGDKNYIYCADYAQEIGNTFGGDPAFEKYEWKCDQDFDNEFSIEITNLAVGERIDCEIYGEFHDFLPGGAIGEYYKASEILEAIEDDNYNEILNRLYDAFDFKGPAEKEVAREIAQYIVDSLSAKIEEFYDERVREIQNGDRKVDDYIREKMIADGKLPKKDGAAK